VLILSELFPEDRKAQDSLRISSCVNSSVGTSLFGISLMCFLFLVLPLTGCGTSVQLTGPTSFLSSLKKKKSLLPPFECRDCLAIFAEHNIQGAPSFVTSTTTYN